MEKRGRGGRGKRWKGGEATEIKKTGMWQKINKVRNREGGNEQGDLSEVATKVKSVKRRERKVRKERKEGQRE